MKNLLCLLNYQETECDCWKYSGTETAPIIADREVHGRDFDAKQDS